MAGRHTPEQISRFADDDAFDDEPSVESLFPHASSGRSTPDPEKAR